ncbi:MAG TPA: hypothetical protein VJ654_13555 [Noviherbaspirillum sp.]|nr:hypothetical protein [Noviherbaspirillum sp.]
MDSKIKTSIDLTVQSFAYAAKQLTRMSPASDASAHYAQVVNEAEKYRSALRLVQRDVFEMTEQSLRQQKLTKTDFQRLREMSVQAIEQAQRAITRIAEQYAPQRLAA